MLIHDTIESCRTFGGKRIGFRLQVVEGRWNTVVLATDLSDDVHSSITLHTDELATSICEAYGIEPGRLLWIEHIPPNPLLGRNDDLWDLVHFEERDGSFVRPIWTPLTIEEVDTLTAGALDDVVPQE